MSDTVRMLTIPRCNFCTIHATHDFRTKSGPWAYGCERHYLEQRATTELGTGNGQRIVQYEEHPQRYILTHSAADFSDGEVG